MKKVLAIVLAMIMILSASAMAAENIVKVGVFEPASGDNGAGGKQEVLGIEYANSLVPTVEIAGEEYKVELVIVDNQTTAEKGVSAAQELVDEEVSIILGSYGSGVSMAGGEIFADAEIPAIGCSCTNPNVTLLCDYYWRVCFLDPFQGKVMASYAMDQYEAKKAYVLTQLGDDYSTGLGYYFAEAFKAMGGEVIEETFNDGNSDFSAYLTKATQEGCDVFFTPNSTVVASLLIDQAATANVSYPLLAGDTWDSSVILEAAKGTNLEICCSTFMAAGASEAVDTFTSGFKAWLNANPDKLNNNGGNDIISAVSALGYDAYMVAIEALKASESIEGVDVAVALPDVTLEGVTGSIAFDENGDAAKDNAYIIKANTETGAFDFVKNQALADLG